MRGILNLYYRGLRVLLTALMIALVVPVTMQILSRKTGIIPNYLWTEEVSRFCFVWIIMIGSIIAVRDGKHFEVDLLPQPKHPRLKAILDLIPTLFMLLFAAVFAWYAMRFAAFGSRQRSEVKAINMLFVYITFPLAGVSWIIFLVERLLEQSRLLLKAGDK